MKNAETKIKICGITTADDVALMNLTQPDYVGFILFYPKSKRNVSLPQVRSYLTKMKPGIHTVGVVVSPTTEEAELLNSLDLHYVQIHGNLSPEVYNLLNHPILKAFNLEDMNQYPRYQQKNKIAGYVFDAVIPGSGETFDWSVLEEVERDEKLFFLAGGITAENVNDAIAQVHPMVVDCSSGVEGVIGKDPAKVKKLIRMVRNAK